MFSAATVSPPPATETSAPAFVSSAAFLAAAFVAVSKGAISKAPSGPFQISVFEASKTLQISSTAFGPPFPCLGPC